MPNGKREVLVFCMHRFFCLHTVHLKSADAQNVQNVHESDGFFRYEERTQPTWLRCQNALEPNIP